MKKICSCFGSNIAYNENDMQKIKQKLIELIEKCNIKEFLVVTEGCFGNVIVPIFKNLRETYSFIKVYRVLAYLNKNDEYEKEFNSIYFDGTIFPDLETTPLKFRIVKRNQLIIDKSDYIVFFSNYVGNIKKLIEYAERKHKKYNN